MVPRRGDLAENDSTQRYYRQVQLHVSGQLNHRDGREHIRAGGSILDESGRRVSTIGVAVVGCGWAGRYAHLIPLRAASNAATLRCVVDVNAELAASAAREFGASAYSTTLEAVLDDPDVDAVIIASPTALHAGHAITAIEAGKHVLVEKPMAGNAADARRMTNAARAHGVVLMVGHCCRFMAAFVEARRLMRTGQAGRPLQIQARRSVMIGSDRVKPWWNEERPDGFLMSWLGSHIVDLTIWLLSQSPSRVYAEFGRNTQGLTGDDSFAALLWFDTGVFASIEQTMRSRDPEHDYVVIGDAGTLRVRDYVHLSRDGTPVDLSGFYAPGEAISSASSYARQQREFFAAIQEHRRPSISGEEGIVTMEVIDACYRAGLTHQVQTVHITDGITRRDSREGAPLGHI